MTVNYRYSLFRMYLSVAKSGARETLSGNPGEQKADV